MATATATRTRNEVSRDDLVCGFTQIQLQAAFDLVANKSDWRAEIDYVVGGNIVIQVTTAIQFFTGTIATVERLSAKAYRVRSEGYRNGPCGP